MIEEDNLEKGLMEKVGLENGFKDEISLKNNDLKEDLKTDLEDDLSVDLENDNKKSNEVSINNSSIKNSKPNLDDLKELNNHCVNLGLCLRCQLRFLGELYSSAVFIGTQNEIKDKINQILKKDEEDNESTVKKFKSDTYCYCCVGLLENCCEDNEIEKILNETSKFEYKFKDFQINLLLPVVIIIRENVVQARLLNRFQHLEKHLKGCYTVKDVYKYVLIRNITKLTNSRLNVDSKTEITIETLYGNTQLECMELYSKCKQGFSLKPNVKFDVTFSQSNVTKALTKLGIKGLINLRLYRPDRYIQIKKVLITNQPLYLVGRYNKYCRTISQTPWVVNDKIKRESLEDIISEQVKKYIICEKTKFSASGREDVDVRMLGRGRPFVIELFQPKTLDIDRSVFAKIRKAVQIASNNDIDLKDLQLGNKDEIYTLLKNGENEKKKQYRALCILTRSITQEDIDKLKGIKDLKIEQKTPLRVLHRRTLSTRPKLIHDLKIELIENETQKFNLIVTTEAGTYVKEFVNSDFGRTHPSLEVVLGDCEADILELDVMEIFSDWPPKIEDEDQINVFKEENKNLAND